MAVDGDEPTELVVARSGNVVELLEALLDRARKGEINSLAAAWEWTSRGGAYRCAHGVGSNAATLAGFCGAAATAIHLRHLITDGR